MMTPIRLGRFALGVMVVVLSLIGLVQSTAVTLGLGLVVAAFAAMSAYGVGQHDGREKPTRAALVRRAAIGLVSVLALAGLGTVLGPVMVPVVLLGLGAVGWYRWRRPDRPGGTGACPAARAPATGADLTGLSDAQLGREWRLSHALLAQAHTSTELDWLCALRRRQLDEMERRNPTGFQRWIGSGGWVTGDSAPFLGT